jgi:Uma2 family endonuclease
MSTAERPSKAPPPLVDGQRLDRATFHRRYAAMPPESRAELVGGVVYMGSPLGYRHGVLDGTLSEWLGYYRWASPGLGKASNATVQLDPDVEVQPDLILRIPEDRGGTSRIAGGFVVGPPELVVEVAVTSRELDLGPKKQDYRRAGVAEYLVVSVDPDAVNWFVLRDGEYTSNVPGPDGLFRSLMIPGLWLDPRALFADDIPGLIAALDRGLATPEHAAFAARLRG